MELFESRYSKMVEDLKAKYYEQEYDKMEPNDAVFEMLKKHHEEEVGNSDAGKRHRFGKMKKFLTTKSRP